ncbi:MAG: hypothetical protein AAB586_02500 [Patescibacteria group bacterium]
MEFDITAFSALGRSAFFNIEMILSGSSRQKFAGFGYLESLGIRLIGFYGHSAPYTTSFKRNVQPACQQAGFEN